MENNHALLYEHYVPEKTYLIFIFNLYHGGKLHGFQLWVNMPAKLKMSKPNYIYIDSDKMSVHKDNDKQIAVKST